MARTDRPGLDTPRSARRRLPQVGMPPDTFGRVAEGIARYMGTPMFLVWMTAICAAWLAWNSMAPEHMQFDPRSLNFTLLTLLLSLQASYAAPLLLLADNRSADRDRVEFEADRQRAERNLADTEFLAREVASLRIAMRDVATRDFIRSELRSLFEEMEETRAEERARDRTAGPDEEPHGLGDSDLGGGSHGLGDSDLGGGPDGRGPVGDEPGRDDVGRRGPGSGDAGSGDAGRDEADTRDRGKGDVADG